MLHFVSYRCTFTCDDVHGMSNVAARLLKGDDVGYILLLGAFVPISEDLEEHLLIRVTRWHFAVFDLSTRLIQFVLQVLYFLLQVFDILSSFTELAL